MKVMFCKKAVVAAFLILSNIAHLNTCLANDKVLLASDFIHPADEDAAPGLYRLFEMAKKGHYTKIQFQKGIYHVYSDHAFEKYCYISNHDSGPRKIAFAILGFNHLEIDGGAKPYF